MVYCKRQNRMPIQIIMKSLAIQMQIELLIFLITIQ